MKSFIKFVKEEVQLEEGYEKTVINVLKDKGIDSYFKNGKLYVAKADVKKASSILKKDRDIIKDPKIVGESFKDEVHELKLYIENDSDLYKQKLVPIVKNIQRKMKSEKYDHKKAPKLWMYLADEGAKKYSKEFPGVKFDKRVRQQVSQEFADEYWREIKYQNGEMFT